MLSGGLKVKDSSKIIVNPTTQIKQTCQQKTQPSRGLKP